jgi:purine-nucleoside phosphorylase
MTDTITMSQIEEMRDAIAARTAFHPKIGLILGSGLGSLVDAVQRPDFIPFSDLPHWPVSTVVGHQGRLALGLLENQEIAVMQGRTHFYEGYSMAQITLPVRALQRFGIETLIVTNAAGAVNQEYEPGDLMLITDHINLIGMAGNNPLRGPNLDEFGPRFPDMSQVYDRGLLSMAREVAARQNLLLREGIYVCLAGPSFETPADLRFLRMIGADAVGMSTVPEVTVARHGGMRVLGVSGISNKANLDGNTITTHQEVLEAGLKIVPKLTGLIRGMLRSL